MTLNEYMNKNFTVIDATSQGMSLQEAIEEVERLGVVGIWEPDEFAFGMTEECRTAIATILNAVVKGELK